MLKKNAQPIASVASEFLNENPGLKIAVAEHRVVSAWRELLGEGVSHYTKNISEPGEKVFYLCWQTEMPMQMLLSQL